MNVTKLGRKLRYYLALSQVLSRADKVKRSLNDFFSFCSF